MDKKTSKLVMKTLVFALNFSNNSFQKDSKSLLIKRDRLEQNTNLKFYTHSNLEFIAKTW
jgi:hypothetical protein